MKNLHQILIIFVIGWMFSGCEKEERGPVPVLGDGPSLAQPASGSQIVFNRFNANEETITFTWSAADFGFPSAITYTLQADVAGNDFSAPIELLTIDSLSASMTHASLNQRLLTMGLETDESIELEFRVIASISPFYTTLQSDPLNINLTLYSSEFPSIYIVGAAVGGWDLAQAVELFSLEDPNHFITITRLDTVGGRNFRFFNQPDWGASLGGYDVFTDYPADLLEPALDNDDPNFNFIGAPGWYEIQVNIETFAIILEPVEEPAMYVTGDATHGWDWDDPVTQLNFVEYNIWEGYVDFTQGGAFRLFAQKDWAPASYGYNIIVNYNTEYIDIMEGHGDPNWEFLKPSGTYFVRVNLRENSIEISE